MAAWTCCVSYARGTGLLRMLAAHAEAARPLPLAHVELHNCAAALPIYVVAEMRDILGDERFLCT